MSRKRKAPIRKVYPDPKFHSEVVSKFINSIMYDGKRSTAEKILYDALEKIKKKNNEDPIKIFTSKFFAISFIIFRDKLFLSKLAFIMVSDLLIFKKVAHSGSVIRSTFFLAAL